MPLFRRRPADPPVPQPEDPRGPLQGTDGWPMLQARAAVRIAALKVDPGPPR